MIEIVPDLHIRPQQPHLQACENFVAWEESRPVEPMTTVNLGDLTDTPENQGVSVALAIRWAQARQRHGDVFIIRGNHDYTKTEGSSLDPLKELGVTVIEYPCIKSIDGVQFLVLPYIWPSTLIDGKKFSSMKEIYSDPAKLEEFTGPLGSPGAWEFSGVLGHFGDETAGAFAMNADLSWYNGPRCLGHIHKRVSKHYPGSARVTRWDERGKENVFVRLTMLEPEKKFFEDFPIPTFMDYAEIVYGEAPRLDEGHTVWINQVVGCPDPALARKEYITKYPTARWRKFERIEDTSAPLEYTHTGGPETRESAYLLNEFGKTGKVSGKAFDLMAKTLRR